jgi:hypothetical protein
MIIVSDQVFMDPPHSASLQRRMTGNLVARAGLAITSRAGSGKKWLGSGIPFSGLNAA